MTNPGHSNIACEDCGARSESMGAFNRPSGVAGSVVTWHTTPGPADVVLGHPGYLCSRCWWKRVAKLQVAA